MLEYADDNVGLPASKTVRILTCYALLHRRVTNLSTAKLTDSGESPAHWNNYVLLVIK
jgi:hypothetical protein